MLADHVDRVKYELRLPPTPAEKCNSKTQARALYVHPPRGWSAPSTTAPKNSSKQRAWARAPDLTAIDELSRAGRLDRTPS